MAIMDPMADDSFIRWMIGAIAALWLTLVSWMGKRQVDRIDELEKSTVAKEDFQTLEKKFDDYVTKTQEFQGEQRTQSAVIVAMLKERRKRMTDDGD